MKTIALMLTLLMAGDVLAQGTRQKDTTGVSSFASFGLRYKSDYYYMGRADSVKAPYVIPSIGYYHKSGLFISGSLSYLTASGENRVDLFTLSAGYDYFGERVAAGLAVDQFFFSDESYSVQAEMSTYVSGYVGYDLQAFMVIADASLGVSDNLDFFLGGEVSRTFYLLRNHLLLTPSFYTNLGTQRYYNEYYTKRTLTTGGMGDGGSGSGPGGNGHGSGSGGTTNSVPVITTITEISIAESEKFQVLDYELGMNATYRLDRFRFIMSGTFLFPVNPATVVTEDGTYEEDLENGFLWTAGIRYRLGK